MREKIKCEKCKKVIGTIDKDALVSASDQYVGIEKYCKDCKGKRISDYFFDVNQLIKK